MEKKYLTKGDIDNIQDIEIKELYVKEWDGWVRVKGLTGKERDEFEDLIVHSRKTDGKSALKNFRATLVSMAMVDVNGKRIYNELEIEELGKKSARALNRIFAIAQSLSGLGKDDVEDLTKNSVTGQEEEPISN